MEDKMIRVGITHGDTNGIGYELIFKTFADPAMFELCTPIVYGSPTAAVYHRKMLGIETNFTIIDKAEDARPGQLNILVTTDGEVKIDMGTPTLESGEAALKAIDKALEDWHAELYDVLVTAPVSKEAISNVSPGFTGHTGYIARRIGGGEPLMILFNGSLRVALVTTHVAIKDVSECITKDAVLRKAKLLYASLLRDFRICAPRIAVLALNPHAGDNGVIGDEEQSIIKPAMEEIEKAGVTAFGPYPADGFFGSGMFRSFDGVLAMYHDQGLAPFKALAGSEGVNVTAGLPIVRTSPDHGTAYDIAGRGVADETSFRHAIYAAIDIYRNRKTYDEPLANPLHKLYHEKKDESTSRSPIPPKAARMTNE